MQCVICLFQFLFFYSFLNILFLFLQISTTEAATRLAPCLNSADFYSEEANRWFC